MIKNTPRSAYKSYIDDMHSKLDIFLKQEDVKHFKDIILKPVLKLTSNDPTPSLQIELSFLGSDTSYAEKEYANFNFTVEFELVPNGYYDEDGKVEFILSKRNVKCN